jgi:hypothetical protein
MSLSVIMPTNSSLSLHTGSEPRSYSVSFSTAAEIVSFGVMVITGPDLLFNKSLIFISGLLFKFYDKLVYHSRKGAMILV